MYDALAVLALTSALTDGGGPSSVIDRLKAFEPKLDRLLFKLEHSPERKIVIGMQRSSYPGYSAIACSVYAKSIGCDFYLFNSEDVDPINKTINAKVYKNGQWLREMRDYPDVVDNEGAFVRSEVGRQMFARIPYTYAGFGGKNDVSAWLETDPIFNKFLIPYALINNGAAAINYINRFTTPIILKPVYANQGHDVMRVTLLSDGNYEIVEDHATKVVALQDLSALLNTVVTKPYIAQKYIKSCLSSGIPFDVRIHVRRNKQAQWDIVKTYVRIGLAKMLTSNVAGGGGVADAQTFLRSHLGKTLGDRTYRRLEARRDYNAPE